MSGGYKGGISKQMKKENKISSNGELEIQFVTSKEPNNGRMLWVVDVILNKININDKIFGNKWNCLNYDLTLWELENSNYYYLPRESKAIILKKDSVETIELKYQNVSTIRFEGNIFHKHWLIEIFKDSIELTNLLTLRNRKIEWIKKGNLKSIEIDKSENLKINYKNMALNEIIEISIN